MASPLDLYESLDVIGTGSFGIIRKVRRKSDGLVFARKELNFQRMSERDRKQIVSEVNILKDLHHENIVRYHDRHVDRGAGILYILMEYCGGGDLSTVIKQAQRTTRAIPEDTIWNYFMQILLALNHCHHPNGHGRLSSVEGDAKDRRPQILHRDLKPDNVFLDENNTVKLGDFGLSKALPQASFAQTYVGTPYYMSPELMQEKAYDSKSDIWSLGCLMYELCALKPPFHEAKTHSELHMLVRNGRIPPLPKGYSTALASVIKSMLNLNPAMRPSAAQLLGHERLELAFKVSETQKMLNAVKSHKTALISKERDLVAREVAAAEKEKAMAAIVAAKDEEIASLRALAASAESMFQTRVREALARREEELRTMLIKQEQQVAGRIAKREEEIMEAVRRREEEIARMWAEWEAKTRETMERAVGERMEWVRGQAEELEQERARLQDVRAELEQKMSALEAASKKDVKAKTPLETMRNILAPLAHLANAPDETPVKRINSPVFETPRPCLMKATPAFPSEVVPPSAMKGVILTATGEPVATPTPAELTKLFVNTPKVGLNFTKIFDFESDTEDEGATDGYESETQARQTRRRSSKGRRNSGESEDNDRTPQPSPNVRPTRLRRPSIRAGSQRPLLDAAPASAPSTISARSSSRPPSAASTASSSSTTTRMSKSSTGPSSVHVPEYDLSDEENLPSPFLKRADRDRQTFTKTASAPAVSSAAMVRTASRKSCGGLRAMAVVNAMNAKTGAATATGKSAPGAAAKTGLRTASAGSLNTAAAATGTMRPSIAKAHKASEEAKKVLFRA